MKKLKISLALAALASAVGISYALFTLRGITDVFDWEDEDDE
jgi:hypothetical protein